MGAVYTTGRRWTKVPGRPWARVGAAGLTPEGGSSYYRHGWRVGDLVIWDNRATMHRATPFEEGKYRRELRRVTTLDIERAGV